MVAKILRIADNGVRAEMGQAFRTFSPGFPSVGIPCLDRH